MEGGLTGDVIAWLSGHTRWLGPAIFLIALLESLAIAGIVVPGVALLFAAAAMAGSAHLSLAGVLAWAFAGAVCGDMISFALGRIFHQDIRRLGLFRKHPQWIDGGEAFFRRYGVLSVLIGRFVGPIRPVIPLVAGMFDMPTWRFVAINLFSAALWAPAYLLPGYVTGSALNWPVPEFFWTQTLALAGGLIAFTALSLMALRKQERWSTLAVAGLSLAGLIGIAMASPWLHIFNATVAGWLEQPGSGLPALARQLLAPLDQPFFLMLLVSGIGTVLLLTAHWRQLAYVALTISGCLAASWIVRASEQSPVIALTLSLVIACAVLGNREQGFWTRVSWALYCTPLIAGIVAAGLTPLTIAPLTAVSAVVQAAFAASLALWLVERGAPVQALNRWPGLMIATWPLIAAALALITSPGWS
ncbi:DedA family protein [Halopseudomonas nanhaiensis]|uniref:DedA family protein n=1 Tax=Halopseudomonas nanhaiensis TaxID=2830842 RepID=UPI001CBBDD1F|nr:DedA family protein [Halopseudomonas nanhaiensis]UAW99165.1 DedA family protein [Halopseudomonas nanhaiensis]